MTLASHTYPESNSRALRRAVALANGWTRVYTSRVGDDAAGRRRAEIESDLWEQLDDIKTSGATAGSVAASILWRVIAGMPADLSWVRYQRAVARGSLKREKELTMNTFVRVVGQWWWVALGIAVGYVLIAAGNLAEPGMPYLDGTILAFGCAALILVGSAVRFKWPVAGGLLIVGGVGPSMLLWWAPVFAVLAALAVVGAALELVILPVAQRRLGGAAAVGRAFALLAAIVATATPLLLGVVPGIAVTGVVAIALAAVALVRRPQRPQVTPTSAA